MMDKLFKVNDRVKMRFGNGAVRSGQEGTVLFVSERYFSIQWDQGNRKPQVYESGYTYLKDITVIGKCDKKQKSPETNTETEYSFPVQTVDMIDMEEIAACLTRKQPIALVYIKTDKGVEMAVIVHKTILRKADECRILPPEKNALFSGVYYPDNGFTPWIAWVKEVREAAYPKGATAARVTVKLPEVF